MTEAITLLDFAYSFADRVGKEALADGYITSPDGWLIYDWLYELRAAAEQEQADEVAEIAARITDKMAACHGRH